ncbi:MAG TPA: DUF4142 domain-containing protein [Flavobacterium sp.]|nr:DUF4142 domain-containing protein [Flavobacterium sp.]
MNKAYQTSKTILSALFLLGTLSLSSCKNENKAEDPKEVAEDQNETKFEESDAKEDDSQFLVDAAETDLKEIEIGKLAQQKGTDPEVKAFGKMLVDDHTKSSGEVKALAQRKNISIPAALTEKGKEGYDELNEKTGADFDKKFAEMMVDGHQKAISKMNDAAEKAADEEIRVWATSKVPTLTQHLEHAKMLKEKIDKKK